jgi:choline monooxygenase
MSEANPWAWYLDPDVLGLERARIFRSAWHYVGHAGRVGQPSSYFACDTGGLPALVVRDQEGELRAFLNVCRHRGAVIAAGEGRRETLQCPYHAWTYGLDGRLRSAPRSDEAELGDIRLLPLRLETWGPFLFVNADPDAEPLSIELDLPFDPAELVFHTRQDYVLGANWKIAVENYLECYHCAVAHPGFTKLVDVAPDTYRLEANGRVWSQYGQARAGEGRSEFHLVWPTLKINVYPGLANLSIGPVWPESPERTVGFLDYFFGSDVPDDQARELLEFDDQVGREDTALVESVQRGVRSGLIDSGCLLPASEQLIQGFQHQVAASLT